MSGQYTISSCVANLPTKFNNRQDLNNIIDGSKPIQAVVESIKELTETYEFEELKYQTPVPSSVPLAMSAGNPVIPISTLLGTIQGNPVYPQFQNQNWMDITDIYTFWMWFAGGVNQAGRALKYRRIPTIDTYSYGITNNNSGQLGVAPPVYYSRFGNNLQVGPVPDNNYQYFVRMKLRHPFPVPVSNFFSPAMFSTTITGGAITSVTILNGGFGYPPSITVALDFAINGTTNIPGVTQANVGGNINSSGSVSSVNIVTGGSGYPVAPIGGTAVLQAQQIFAPDSWQEIIELCACQRLALWEGASEYITYFESLLKTKGIDVAAARARKAQMVRDENHNERSMSLMTSTYTWA